MSFWSVFCKRAAAGGITASAAGGGWVAYDYSTCHPMRKMMWSVGGSVTRFRNLVPAKTGITLAELSRFDGREGRPLYFSAGGNVYDASSSEMFRTAYPQWAGKDATFALATMSLSPDAVNNTANWHNLSKEETETLASWVHYFGEKYVIKGRLVDYDENS